MKVEEVIAAATNTFSLPEVCVKLREAIDNPTVDIDVIASMISADPLLSAKILRLANSALFRFPSQVETISKALSILGMEATYNLVMADAASQMRQAFKPKTMDTDAFWYRCLFKGVMAKETARKLRIRGTERFFVLGILCNLSELVVAANFEADYVAYMQDKTLYLPWQAQQQHFHFSFPLASSHICKAWGLPLGLYAPLSKVFDATAKDRDASVLQLAIKLVMHHQDHDEFHSLSSLEPELSMWHHTEEELYDLIEFCHKEAKRLQRYF
ncbi:HDOD domain-containing protein [Alteromonas sediminis]|uniref:HDOD domain-containing protein n=1 Tax=Alteromonas sediminis TaxID=2259342 RepID=A0A3N5ZA93_9ALTE|nr:HDOD domain-containing protein [Alteromonas sediminis]RPJ67974.1 HDOD domain-containing protein [Alteromonas sediminis]